MNSTNASSSNPSKKIKLTIIPPRQLFVNISSDEEVTTTPSPTTTSSSPTPPNAPSKTSSTNQTSSSQDNTLLIFNQTIKFVTSILSDEPTSPQPFEPLLEKNTSWMSRLDLLGEWSRNEEVLSKEYLKGTRIEHGFKRAFMSLFRQDNDTFTSTMLLNVNQLQKQLDNQMTDKYFVEYTGIEVKQFKETLLQHMSNVKKSVAERTRHKRLYDRRVNKRQMQKQESKFNLRKELDVGLVVMESNGTELEVQDDSSRSGNETDADDADIRTIYDKEPMAKIFTKHTFSSNKTTTVYEKTSPRSDLRWKPTGRIFKTISLRWIPKGKILASCTSKDDSEPTHGSNVNIPNIQECKQTLDLSTSTSLTGQQKQRIDFSAELESRYGPLFDEYFNGENQVVSKSSAVTTADASDKRQQQPDSTSSTSTLATTVTADGNFDL
ncbi:hypothetical protein Tco_1403405 [Tanacetum coccineum]